MSQSRHRFAIARLILVGLSVLMAIASGGWPIAAADPAVVVPGVNGGPSSGAVRRSAVLRCGQEQTTQVMRPSSRDLIVGPLSIPNGRRLAHADPRGYGARGDYKMPIVLAPGSSASLTIAPDARWSVRISNPYVSKRAVKITYRACADHWGFFAQSFRFIDGRTKGCVPLEITIGRLTRVHRVTLDLFKASCA